MQFLSRKASAQTISEPKLFPVELIHLILVEHATYTVHSACLGLAPYHQTITGVLKHAFTPAAVSRTFRRLWVKCLMEAFDIPVTFIGQTETDLQYNLAM